MALVTVSEKRNRVYQRAFDHDEARALRESDPKTWTFAALAAHFGVTWLAVQRVLDPVVRARMDAEAKRYHENHREPCKGGCGARVWAVSKGRTGYCPACLAKARTADDVRDSELRCLKCGEWKPDAAFGRAKRQTRRGRRPWCSACDTAARRAHRKANPEQERATYRRQKREGKPMTTFTVLRRNGSGWIDHAEVEAVSGLAAVEKAATEAGEYVAVSLKQVCRVEPVTSMKVVRGARTS